MLLPPQNKPIIRTSKSGNCIEKENIIYNDKCEQYTIYINDMAISNKMICTRYKENDKTINKTR